MKYEAKECFKNSYYLDLNNIDWGWEVLDVKEKNIVWEIYYKNGNCVCFKMISFIFETPFDYWDEYNIMLQTENYDQYKKMIILKKFLEEVGNFDIIKKGEAYGK